MSGKRKVEVFEDADDLEVKRNKAAHEMECRRCGGTNHLTATCKPKGWILDRSVVDWTAFRTRRSEYTAKDSVVLETKSVEYCTPDTSGFEFVEKGSELYFIKSVKQGHVQETIVWTPFWTEKPPGCRCDCDWQCPLHPNNYSENAQGTHQHVHTEEADENISIGEPTDGPEIMDIDMQ